MRTPLESRTSPPLAGKGDVVVAGAFSEGTVSEYYPHRDFAASMVAARFRLSPPIARLVCELASIGRACA